MALIKKKAKAIRPKQLTRKQLRKEQRKDKKVKRNEFYNKKQNQPGKFVLNPNKQDDQLSEREVKRNSNQKLQKSPSSNKVLNAEEQRKKEQKQQKTIEKQMKKQRKEQLKVENLKEDQNIKRLEKQLKLHKRKTKSIPKSFSADGLDYLLEVCDSENIQSAVAAEKQFLETNEEFEEDFALMTGSGFEKGISEKNLEDEDNLEDFLNQDDISDAEILEDIENSDNEVDSVDNLKTTEESSDSQTNGNPQKRNSVQENNNENKLNKGTTKKQKYKVDNTELQSALKRKNEGISSKESKRKVAKRVGEESVYDFDFSGKSDNESSDLKEAENENSCTDDDIQSKGLAKKNADGTWEDIYGRLRSKDGEIINSTNENKYIPPAVRAKLKANNPEDKKRIEKLIRLKRQLKGLLNRLAESNMHNISTQIEDLYMNNSRNDMNESLTNLILESLISNVIAPERLLMEHVLLIVILHANIGTEIGAHFLQTVVKKFDELKKSDLAVENKSLDNTVNILAQLYNFKLFDAKLLYEVLQKLSGNFEEKDVECILHILRSVGFGLRKDDPLALKSLILDLQKKASSASDEIRDNARVKFMLEILLAIKNNNVTKIPNYDTSYSEHLKKIMKSFIRKGNYVTQLNISLEDLLKADQRGKWWVVGSAWSGNLEKEQSNDVKTHSESFSSKLLELARKQRMNTDTRRSIFCIIMSAEDYLDAFEKLLRLGLKNQQEREIIHVILHCCSQEKVYNPYYSVLSQKFCEYDRKYQMTIKYSVWDKLKALSEHSGSQISNLAKLLTHLFIEKGLSISTLKIVEFGELDKITLRFMRQILLGILLHSDTEACVSVFEKVSQSSKLKMFRESLRLFIHHFLLKNLKSGAVPENQKDLLQSRAKLVETILTAKEGKLRF